MRWPSRSLLAILATSVLTAILVSCLPENVYSRFQQLDNTEYRNLRWIYERTHFDAKKIDIAILGSSRIATGVDPRLLEASLEKIEPGLIVENFGIPFSGRNLDLEIVRELLTTKEPRLLIIGVPERPSSHTHVTYKYIAPSTDVVASIGYGNIDYFSDLFYLPYRHLKSIFSRVSRSAAETVKEGYEDPVAHIDASFTREPGGRWLVSYPQRRLAELEVGAKRALALSGTPPLSKTPWIANLGAERRNILAITKLAEAHHVKVVFLFIPQFMSDGTITERDFYQRHGQLLDAAFLSTRPDYYSSWGHLNERGATAVNAWLCRQLLDARIVARTNRAGA